MGTGTTNVVVRAAATRPRWKDEMGPIPSDWPRNLNVATASGAALIDLQIGRPGPGSGRWSA